MRSWRLAVLCLSAAATTWALEASGPQRSPAPPPMLLGIADGNQGWDIDRLRALDDWIGRPHDVIVLYTNWDPAPAVMRNLFEHQLPALWTHGAVPMITWEPYVGARTPPDVVSRAAAGEFDEYFAEWGGRLRTFLAGPDAHLNTSDDRRVYLRPGHEMNGNWYPWGQRAPGRFVEMWKRMHGMLDDLGLGPTHVQWVWCVTNVDHGPFSAESYYPGDRWVDWVGVDGYNWGVTGRSTRWLSAAEVLEPMITRIRGVSTRPVALAEVATTRHTLNGGAVTAKNAWIADFFAWLPTSGVRMVCWFNLDRDADFAVFGGELGDVTVPTSVGRTHGYSAYQQHVRQLPVQVRRAHPRRLADALFMGQDEGAF